MKVAAWIRGVVTPSSPHGSAEHDADVVPGEEHPGGTGWRPLYSEREVVLKLNEDRNAIVEECAKVAERQTKDLDLSSFFDRGAKFMATLIARDIRALSSAPAKETT